MRNRKFFIRKLFLVFFCFVLAGQHSVALANPSRSLLRALARDRRLQVFSGTTTATLLFIATVSFAAVKRLTQNQKKYCEKDERDKRALAQKLERMGAKKVSFKSADGFSIHAYELIRPEASRNIIVCHGYTSTKEFMIHQAELFPHDNLLLLDLRSHGESDGELVSFSYYEKNDVIAAVEYWRRKGISHLPLYGLGVSMGGATLLAAQHERPLFKALIIDSTFAQLAAQLKLAFQKHTGLPKQFFGHASSYFFARKIGIPAEKINPEEYVKKINIPLLLMHSVGDELIPVENAHALYAAAKGRKKLWIAPRCKHAALCRSYPDEYKKQIDAFFAEMVS